MRHLPVSLLAVSLALSFGGCLPFGVERVNSTDAPPVSTVVSGTAAPLGVDGSVNALASAPDGSGDLIVGGSFHAYRGSALRGLVRINADGSIDSAFQPDLTFPGEIFELNVDAGTGAIYAKVTRTTIARAGITTSYGTVRSYARFASDGRWDTTFNPAWGAKAEGFAVAKDGTGDLLIGVCDGATGLVRRGADGISASAVAFTSQLPVSACVTRIAPIDDGSGDFYIGGNFGAYGATSAVAIVRLHADGSLDSGFASAIASVISRGVDSIAVAGDRSVYVSGFFTVGSASLQAIHLLADGSYDPTFVPQGILAGSDAWFTWVPESPSTGRLYVRGYFALDGKERLALFQPSGALDPSLPVIQADEAISTFLPDGQGGLYVGGPFSSYGGQGVDKLMHVDAVGALDSAFNQGSGIHGLVAQYSRIGDGSGKRYLAGDFDRLDGQPLGRLARLNSDGSIDSTLQIGTGFDQGISRLVPRDGAWSSFYVLGGFSKFDGVAASRITRLLPSGARDLTFDPGAGLQGNANYSTPWSSGYPYDAALDETGALWVVGAFVSYRGTASTGVARIAADGTSSSGFSAGTGFDNRPLSVSAIPGGAGAVYIGGLFTAYRGATANYLVRLLPDGTADPAFVTGSGFNAPVFAVKSAEDGSGDVFVAGDFTTYQGAPANHLIRLHADGSVATTFQVGAGFDARAYALERPCGRDRLYVAGYFTSYQGAAVPNLVRLDPLTGALDTSFDIGSGFYSQDSWIPATAIGSIEPGADPAGDVLFAGFFHSLNSRTADSIVHVDARGAPLVF